MASNIRISELPLVTGLGADDLFELVQGGASVAGKVSYIEAVVGPGIKQDTLDDVQNILFPSFRSSILADVDQKISDNNNTQETNYDGRYLQIANNLNDLNNAATARQNLEVPGLGTVNAYTAMQQWNWGTAVTAADPLVLPTDGNAFVVSGTTTITQINTVRPGTVVYLLFADSLVLQHSDNLRCPGGVSIYVQPNDLITLIEYQAGKWQVLGAPRGTGAASPTESLYFKYPYVRTADHRLQISFSYNSTTDEATFTVYPDQKFILNGTEYDTGSYTAAQRTFTVSGLDPNPFHLFFTPTNGFEIKNLGDSAYNPSGLPEAHSSFDSTETRMLCAVYYGGSDPANFITLRNGHLYGVFANTDIVDIGDNTTVGDARYNHRGYRVTYNWARKPSYLQVVVYAPDNEIQLITKYDDSAIDDYPDNWTRYSASIWAAKTPTAPWADAENRMQWEISAEEYI